MQCWFNSVAGQAKSIYFTAPAEMDFAEVSSFRAIYFPSFLEVASQQNIDPVEWKQQANVWISTYKYIHDSL